MQALWKHSPASVREVMESLPQSNRWAYSTVKTLLSRLSEKAAVEVSKRTNTSYFEPLISQPQAQQSEIRNLVDRVFDGTVGGLVQHLLNKETLNSKQQQALTALLEEEMKGDGHD